MLNRRLAGIASLAAVLSMVLVLPSRPKAAAPLQKDRKGTALVYGSVFSEEGLALPDAQVRIRHRDDKKPKWKTRTNRRGEFAVRLPRASGGYVLTIHAKDHADQTKEFVVTLEERFNFYFRLKHPEPEKEEEEDE